MALEKELEYFQSVKSELLKNHKGKFALIKDDKFIGAFDSPDNAYAEGVKQFGQGIFLVRRISEVEEVHRNQALSLGLVNAHI